MGASDADLELLRQRLAKEREAAQTLVWPENWHAVMVFNAMSRQWHWLVSMAGGAQRQALRMSALDAVMKAVKPQLPKGTQRPYHQVFEQLQLLEGWALEALAKA